MLFFLQVPFLHHKNSNAIKDMVTNFSAEVCFEDQLKKCSSFQFVENIVFLFVHLAVTKNIPRERAFHEIR